MKKSYAIIIVFVLAGALFYYFWYLPHHADKVLASGDANAPDNSGLASPAAAANPDPPAQTTPAASPSPKPTQQVQALPVAASTSMQPPARDTISPQPPNGMVFSGSGQYELYREGNITWRFDTKTGQACIIFATHEEWRKSEVYARGCASS